MRTLPDLSIRQLEYLVAVADHDTWADAAANVGVSPSALSQGLAELERRVGVDLFERDGRRRRLRPVARPVLDHARQVVGLTADLTAWADRLQSAATGRVALGMVDVAAVVHFRDLVRTFRRERPDVDLTLAVAPSRDLLDDLVAGRLDLAVCVEPPDVTPGIETTELLRESLVVYAPPDVTVGPPPSWGPWVLFPDGSHTRATIDHALHDVGAPIDVAAVSHQPDVLREMVGLGLGWTVLPRSQGELESVPLTVGPELRSRGIVLARRAGSIHDPAADELADRLFGSQGAT